MEVLLSLLTNTTLLKRFNQPNYKIPTGYSKRKKHAITQPIGIYYDLSNSYSDKVLLVGK